MEHHASLKIFLVDDDLFCLNIYQQHLSNLGHSDVSVFDNGMSCLESLEMRPDIIFLDHDMQVMSGVELLKKIKKANPDIYVVFISGQDDLETAMDSLKYGAFDYIIKGSNETRHIELVINEILEIRELLKKRDKGFMKKILTA